MQQQDLFGGTYAPDSRVLDAIEAEDKRKALISLGLATILGLITAMLAFTKGTVAPHLSILDVFLPAIAGGTVFVIVALIEKKIAPIIAALIRAFIAFLTALFLFAALVPAALVYFMLLTIKPVRNMGNRFGEAVMKFLRFEEKKAKSNYGPA